MESSMCKRRRKMFPPLPMDAQDLCQLIIDFPFVHLYRESAYSERSYVIIFASDFVAQAYWFSTSHRQNLSPNLVTKLQVNLKY